MTLERHNFRVLLDSLSDEDYHDFLEEMNDYDDLIYPNYYFTLEILLNMKYEYKWIDCMSKGYQLVKVYPIYKDRCLYYIESTGELNGISSNSTYDSKEDIVKKVSSDVERLTASINYNKATLEKQINELQKLKQTYGIE